MSRRTLNLVLLIGNLANNPHFSTTNSGHAMCTFTIATDRAWKTGNAEEKKETQWHWVVAWDKLAEICNQLLNKGTRIFIEGMVQYRQSEEKEKVFSRRGEVILRKLIVLEKIKINQGKDETSQKD